MFQISRYVTWPEYARKRNFFSIYLCESDSLKSALDEASGQVYGRPFQVLQINSWEQAKSCQMLFVRHLDGKALTMLLSAIKGLPVLLCSDSEVLLKNGASLLLQTLPSHQAQ